MAEAKELATVDNLVFVWLESVLGSGLFLWMNADVSAAEMLAQYLTPRSVRLLRMPLAIRTGVGGLSSLEHGNKFVQLVGPIFCQQ